MIQNYSGPTGPNTIASQNTRRRILETQQREPEEAGLVEHLGVINLINYFINFLLRHVFSPVSCFVFRSAVKMTWRETFSPVFLRRGRADRVRLLPLLCEFLSAWIATHSTCGFWPAAVIGPRWPPYRTRDNMQEKEELNKKRHIRAKRQQMVVDVSIIHNVKDDDQPSVRPPCGYFHASPFTNLICSFPLY